MQPSRSSQTLGAIIGGIVVLYLVVYLVGTIKQNYNLQQQINVLQQQITTIQAEKDDLNYKIRYYQTDSYQEKEARAKLGLQQPGEGVIILPNSKSKVTQVVPHANVNKGSNWQQWIDFLSGHNAQ